MRPSSSNPRSKRLMRPESRSRYARISATSARLLPIALRTRAAPSGRPRPRNEVSSAPTSEVTARLKRRTRETASSIYLTLVRYMLMSIGVFFAGPGLANHSGAFRCTGGSRGSRPSVGPAQRLLAVGEDILDYRGKMSIGNGRKERAHGHQDSDFRRPQR